MGAASSTILCRVMAPLLISLIEFPASFFLLIESTAKRNQPVSYIRYCNPPTQTTAAPRPAVNPWGVALTATIATFMELLDTSIAEVSLPYIAGGLGRSYDEVTWIPSLPPSIKVPSILATLWAQALAASSSRQATVNVISLSSAPSFASIGLLVGLLALGMQHRHPLHQSDPFLVPNL